MKIGLFQGGKPGTMYAIPEDDPERELVELLGGETEMTPLTSKLSLVYRADGEEARLPIRYTQRENFREPEPIAGDCAVVAVKPGGCLRDIKGEELAEVRALIRPVEV